MIEMKTRKGFVASFDTVPEVDIFYASPSFIFEEPCFNVYFLAKPGEYLSILGTTRKDFITSDTIFCFKMAKHEHN